MEAGYTASDTQKSKVTKKLSHFLQGTKAYHKELSIYSPVNHDGNLVTKIKQLTLLLPMFQDS